jgi:hypothetical protein
MRKIAGVAALALPWSLALCQPQNVVQVESRMIGTWKLESERVLAGRGYAPSVALGTVMTIRKDASGRLILGSNPPYKAPANTQVDVSPDGKTLTETVTSPERQYYPVDRIWKRQ